MKKIKEHFENLAKDYEYYKKKNSYYYDSLKVLLAELIESPSRKVILDLGCGTGELLAYLDPKIGFGIDISKNMVAIAKKKNKDYTFIVSAAEKVDRLSFRHQLDYIIAVDIIEHLDSVDKTIECISEISSRKTKVIFIMANPMWEPILLLLEKLKLKMPEGPHHRISHYKFKKIIEKNNLVVKDRNHRLLIPANIFLFKEINTFFYKIPILKSFGLVEYLIIEKR